MKELEKENPRLRRPQGNFGVPRDDGRSIDQRKRELPASERRIYRVLRQNRSTHFEVPWGADDEEALTEDIVALAKH
jgi:hypothetical protein